MQYVPRELLPLPIPPLPLLLIMPAEEHCAEPELGPRAESMLLDRADMLLKAASAVMARGERSRPRGE